MPQVTQAFQDVLQAHFDALAERDELFNKEYSNPAKSLENCCNYILREVQKSGKCGFTDDEVFCLGLHYYSEPTLTTVDPIKQSCRIITNRHDDTQAQRPQAITNDSKRIPKPRKKAQANTPSLFDTPQPTLFDF
jgi:hypothetical protein